MPSPSCVVRIAGFSKIVLKNYGLELTMIM